MMSLAVSGSLLMEVNKMEAVEVDQHECELALLVAKKKQSSNTKHFCT